MRMGPLLSSVSNSSYLYLEQFSDPGEVLLTSVSNRSFLYQDSSVILGKCLRMIKTNDLHVMTLTQILFFHCYDQSPNESAFVKKNLLWLMLQGDTVHHSMVGEVAGHTASTIRKQSAVKAVAPLILSFFFSERRNWLVTNKIS